MRKPALIAYQASDTGLGPIDNVKLFSFILQKGYGHTTEEAREKALEMVLGARQTKQYAPKPPRADHVLRQGGPPWVTISRAADSFGISRRTIERWVRSGCNIVLPSGQVLSIALKQRPMSASSRGCMVSLAQLQQLILHRQNKKTPGRQLPIVRINKTYMPKVLDGQAAKNMWRCGRAVTLLRGVTDVEMLRQVRDQISLQERRLRQAV